MYIKKISREEFKEYSENSPYYNIWQCVEMADLKSKTGFSVEFVGLFDNDNLITAFLLVYRTVMGHRQYSVPRGFLIDYNDTSLLTELLEELKKYAKKNKALSVTINPYIPYKERDLDGNIVENGYDNSNVLNLFEKESYKHQGFTRGIDPHADMRWIYIIPTDNKTEEELLESFERKTRRSVQKTIKYKIYTHRLDERNLDEFFDVMNSTSERRGFDIRSKNYYYTILKTYGSTGHLEYLSAILNVNNYIDSLNEDKKQEEDIIKDCDEKLSKVHNSNKMIKKKEIAESNLAQYNKHLEEAYKLKEEKGEEIVLSSGVFYINKNEVICMFSGVYEEYMQFASPYAMHWQMMKYCVEHNIPRYNLYGISGIFDESAEDYGVYLFKKGFNGKVVELIGDFVYSASPLNFIYNFLRKVKNKIKS